jgi:DNA-binding response OmpR family regulator
LIVEDDRALRELYRVALSIADFDVHASENGLDALRFLDQERPDVIVLDLNLPRVSGIEIYEELRARPATEDIPIIVVTGVESVPHLPGATICRKPCPPEALTAAVQRALKPHQTAWLFSRGDQSVRIVRVVEKGRPFRLLVYGPGRSEAIFEDDDVIGITGRQAAIERTLIAEGYQQVQLFLAERRSGDDRRGTPRGWPPERRRTGRNPEP